LSVSNFGTVVEDTSDADKDHSLKKKEHQQLEDATRKLILVEERRQQLAREVDVGPSGTPSTNDGAPRVGEGATDGVPTVDPAGSGNRIHSLLQRSSAHMCHKFVSPYVLLYFVH